MTNAKPSSSVKRAARSNASRAAADERSRTDLVRRAAEACDMLGLSVGRGAIVVAASGGADSAAALHIVRQARPHARLFACYVDHRARPRTSIERDVHAVRAQARVAAAKVAVLPLERKTRAGQSIEAGLRAGRYAALASFAASVGASFVVTGHHLDDLAETAVLALVRGAGIDGLAAMQPRRPIAPGVNLARPLLWASKASLERYAGTIGLPVSIDETNADPRFRRNAVRMLLAGLEAAAPGSTRAIARSAAVLADERTLLDAVTRSAWRSCSTSTGDRMTVSALRLLPTPLLRRVLRLAVKRGAGTARDFSFDHCDAIARAVKERRGGSYHAGAARAILSGGMLTILPVAAPVVRAGDARTIVVPQRSVRLKWGGGTISMQRGGRAGADKCIRLDADVLSAGMRLEVRRPRAGDRFVPGGRRSAVSLARYLAKEGIPINDRRNVPLLCAGDAVAAVLGVRAAAPFAARPGGNVLEVGWTPANAVGHSNPDR